MVNVRSDLEAAIRAASAVVDPEIPALTIEDMGILRGVEVGEDGSVEVRITPTYSGCPAMSAIRDDIEAAIRGEGFVDVTVRTVLSPAWTTEWMTERGKRRLEESAIAPPHSSVRCPRCHAGRVTEISRFGTTACKALMVCDACREPFDLFKEI